MAALNLPTRATYEVHEHVKVDTTDNEDHTFCGIMFPIKAKALLPVEHIIIKSVAVRGELGPLTVYVSNAEDPHHRSGGSGATHGHHTEHGDENGPAFARPAGGEYQFRLTARHWTKVYEHTHAPSFHQYTTLTFPEPIVLYPGQVRALYVHSQAPGDEAIVYDNTEGRGGRGGFAHGPGRAQGAPRYEDAMLALYSGRAHLSPFPFGQTPICT